MKSLGGQDNQLKKTHYKLSCTIRRTLAPAKVSRQQLRCRASGGLPQWNFSDASVQINHYGEVLRTNKNRVGKAADDASASLEEKALVIAMAMQETTLMMVCRPVPGFAQSGSQPTCI